jgi:hypothetical protein
MSPTEDAARKSSSPSRQQPLQRHCVRHRQGDPPLPYPAFPKDEAWAELLSKRLQEIRLEQKSSAASMGAADDPHTPAEFATSPSTGDDGYLTPNLSCGNISASSGSEEDDTSAESEILEDGFPSSVPWTPASPTSSELDYFEQAPIHHLRRWNSTPEPVGAQAAYSSRDCMVFSEYLRRIRSLSQPVCEFLGLGPEQRQKQGNHLSYSFSSRYIPSFPLSQMLDKEFGADNWSVVRVDGAYHIWIQHEGNPLTEVCRLGSNALFPMFAR